MDSSIQRQNRRSLWPIWVASGLFILLACVFIPLTGIQADEALFSSPLFRNIQNGLLYRLRHPGIPLMLMTYLGTLKTWLYWLWSGWMPQNVWTIRLPMVLLTAASIFVFFRLLDSAVGRRAAIMGAFLLAVDPMFLLTATFDWGPVAIEHFLLVTGCFLLFRFGSQFGPLGPPNGPIWHTVTQGRERFLGGGFFLLGLGLWNKAIFAWALTGLGVAAITTLWPFVKRELHFRTGAVRTLAIAATSFLLGASPVIFYNLRQSGATVGENAHFDLEQLPEKWQQLQATFNGSALFGYVTADSTAIWDSQIFWAMIALLLLVPLWWRSRAAWFSLVFCFVAWWLMALTKGAGSSVHHTILLWPFPVLFASVVLSRLPKYLGAAAAIVMVVMHLTVVNQYRVELQSKGAGLVWTDAIFQLSDELKLTEGKPIIVMDWGIYDSLHLLHKGRLNLHIASGPLTPDNPSPAEVADLHWLIDMPDAIWISHLPGQEVMPNVGRHLDSLLEAEGRHRNLLKTVPDSHGRPVFVISRVEK